jgi:nitroreductase
MMQFFEVVDTRRSVRAFTATPIERDKLETILATTRLAPSAGGLEAYKIVVIDEVDAKAALAAAALDRFVAEAPVVLVFCASPIPPLGHQGRTPNLFAITDNGSGRAVC